MPWAAPEEAAQREPEDGQFFSVRPTDLRSISIRHGAASAMLAAVCHRCSWEMNFSTDQLSVILETCQDHQCRRTTHEAMAEELRAYGWTVTR